MRSICGAEKTFAIAGLLTSQRDAIREDFEGSLFSSIFASFASVLIDR